jgi:tripeptide aminopeptidase
MKRTLVLAAAAALAFPTAPVGAQLPDLARETAQARTVLASEPMTRALEYLRSARDETVREWLSLCEAYGPSGGEEPRAQLIYRLFRMYGLQEVRIDDAFNVIGVRHGTGGGPTVVLDAHHDNVPLMPEGQPIAAFEADGRVWCPAAGDDLMGVTQLLTVLRAMNAADLRTRGDVWFVTVSGEEAPTGPSHPDASPGMELFVRSNYPTNLDWARGDIIVQFHGQGGAGVATGSIPVRNRSQLRMFADFDRDRWAPHAVDALARAIVRIGREVRDPRSTDIAFATGPDNHPTGPVLYLNMGMIQASEIIARPASEAWVRFDMRADTEARLDEAHAAIRNIAAEVSAEMGEGFSFAYDINSRNGREQPIAGWSQVDNAPARMAAAAASVLYGGTPVIDSTSGCGDCVRAYRGGMPAFSFAGSVVDYDDGRFEVRRGPVTTSATRVASASHDVTESAEIVRVWAGVKQALLFTVTYTGLAR